MLMQDTKTFSKTAHSLSHNVVSAMTTLKH